MKRKARLLLVDDEGSILSSLQRVFRKDDYDILIASSGHEALKVLEEEQGNVSLLISDHTMPGMTGVELTNAVKERWPDIVRIMLTGNADIGTARSAINTSEVYRFLSKPCDSEELRATVGQALEQKRLREENRELTKLTHEQNKLLTDLNKNLEQKVHERTLEIEAKNTELEELYRTLKSNFTAFVRVFISLLELHSPRLGGHCKRVAAMSKMLAQAKKLSSKETESIEVAALLHDIGLIGVPELVASKFPQELGPQEKALLVQHPAVGQECLAGVESLKEVGLLIRSHHEQYDGKGYPDGISGTATPIGARIIAVADAYDRIMSDRQRTARLTPEVAVHRLRAGSGRMFDPAIVELFAELINEMRTGRADETALPVESVVVGMVLTRDLYTGSGQLLLAKDETVSPAHFERIRSFHQIDPVVNPVFVLRKSVGELQKKSDPAKEPAHA